MQAQPSVIATGDFLYFAPGGQDFTVPGAGVVSCNAKPDPTDPIWTTFALGDVSKPTTDKVDAKAVPIKGPMPGTGIIVTKKIVRPTRGLTMEVEMNEFSRLAAAGFYKSNLIGQTDTEFYPLSGDGSIEGWLKRQRYDNDNGLWIIDDWWVDMDVTDLKINNDNIVNPNFTFTWLYSPLAASGI